MEILNKTLTQAEQQKTRVSVGIILHIHTHPTPTSSFHVRPCFWTAKHGASCTDLPGIADLQHQLQTPQAGFFLLCKAHGNSRSTGRDWSTAWLDGCSQVQLLWNRFPQWPCASQTYRQEGWCVQPAAFAAGGVCSPEGKIKTFQSIWKET